MKATLILENGAVFRGHSIGAAGERMCELVFHTAMTGYQELLTDPACAGQGLVMSYPLVGNYGVNAGDWESKRVWCAALVVRHLSPRGSNFRCEGSLGDFLKEHGVVGIEGVDTRAITRILRSQGTMNAMITCAEDFSMEEKLAAIRACSVGAAVARTTPSSPSRREAEGEELFRVAVLDCGVTEGILSALTSRGCALTLFPAHTPAREILEGGFDGVLLSPGPGDPTLYPDIIAQVRVLYDSPLPLFAVGLGHQLLALATGAKVRKMRFGHRGCNHPVRDLREGRLFITSQNHGYCVDGESVDPAVAALSHINVNDGSAEGLDYARGSCLSVQFSPLGRPGPDALFDRFLAMMEKGADRNAEA